MPLSKHDPDVRQRDDRIKARAALIRSALVIFRTSWQRYVTISLQAAARTALAATQNNFLMLGDVHE